ncbi:MAG: hypothetical protein GX592_04655 [Clostridiales bacterium]|nr:hypothetical protein [Clostridiales bacterium]
MNYFWSNTIWYLLLLASSIAAITTTSMKSRDRRFTAAFNLSVLGFTYCIEVSLLILFNAYTYFPMLTPRDAFMDAVLGNIFSQISVSSTAVLCCVLGLRGRFVFVFAGVYYLIDLLFVHLGIYEHYWYRSIYTFWGFVIYCWIVKKWYVMLTKERNASEPRGAKLKKYLLTTTLFLAIFAAAGNTLFTTQKVAGLQAFRSGIFSDASRDHTTTGLIYIPIMIALTILVYRWKRPAAYKVAALLFLFACQWALYGAGILVAIAGWFFFAATIDILGFYFWTALLDRLLTGSPPPSQSP